jgi:predicted aspartyl protease
VSIEFPLPQKHTPLGPVSDPKIPVAVRTTAGYRTYRFLIDTGADFSLAPRRLAQQIGLDWDALPETQVMGVEQSGVRARLGHLPIRVENVELIVRCLFVDTRKSLFILGRADFLDRFILTIDQRQQKIILAEVP